MREQRRSSRPGGTVVGGALEQNKIRRTLMVITTPRSCWAQTSRTSTADSAPFAHQLPNRSIKSAGLISRTERALIRRRANSCPRRRSLHGGRVWANGWERRTHPDNSFSRNRQHLMWFTPDPRGKSAHRTLMRGRSSTATHSTHSIQHQPACSRTFSEIHDQPHGRHSMLISALTGIRAAMRSAGHYYAKEMPPALSEWSARLGEHRLFDALFSWLADGDAGRRRRWAVLRVRSSRPCATNRGPRTGLQADADQQAIPTTGARSFHQKSPGSITHHDITSCSHGATSWRGLQVLFFFQARPLRAGRAAGALVLTSIHRRGGR